MPPVLRELRGRRILVTGGAGFIGSHLVERLARESPAAVVVADNLFLGRRENLEGAQQTLGARLITCWVDATDLRAVRAVIAEHRPEVVFHLAVVPLPTSLERPAWTYEQNIQMTVVLCEAQREGLFRTLVHFSSSEVYGTARYVPMDEAHPLDPSTPYAASKAACDHLVRSYVTVFGTDSVIVRPFNNYGPRQNAGSYAGVIPEVLGCLVRGKPARIFGNGDQTRDFIFVRDTVDATIAVFRYATTGEIFNVASGREVSVNEIVRLLGELTGTDLSPVHEPPRPGDLRRHLASGEALRRRTGFVPLVDLRAGLAETVSWYAAQAAKSSS